MPNYMKQPLLENKQSKLYSSYTDETSDLRSTEQLAIYAIFLRNQLISKHFISLIPSIQFSAIKLSAI